MGDITVKGLPEDLYKRLKQRADRNRRSINQEIITCLEHELQGRQIDPETLLTRARRMREKTSRLLSQTNDYGT